MTLYGDQCQCQGGNETCDGFDNDCDGIADNGATCSQVGYTCQSGTCACAGTCNGTCTDVQTDDANCGSCGHACKADQFCQNGSCANKPTCSPGCGPLEKCVGVLGGTACVAKSVAVPGGYSIDATEVTRDQYAAWLGKSPSTAGQPAYCSWNTDFTPTCEWPPGEKGEHPVVCVDWCDAYAYCQTVGKRLCGRIGGGANLYNDCAYANKSQWYAACSSGGQNAYPYGDTYSSSACNTEGSTTVPVGSEGGCQSSVSGYAGVYDLSGNVLEWEDSCKTQYGQNDECHLRGGSFNYGYGYSRDCDGDYADDRSYGYGLVGFRCCAP